MDLGGEDGDFGEVLQESVDSTWGREEGDDVNFLLHDSMFLEDDEGFSGSRTCL